MHAAAVRYRAFISYSHRDKAVAAWVQSALERYHLPAKLVGRDTSLGPVPARLHPLFRDRDELPASSDLGSELMAALRQSLFLILVCSPASARSRWVNEEVLNFKRMHGEGRVLALICDGEPGDPERECFPQALQYLIGSDGELTSIRAEPIAADIRPNADGKRLAKFKLIAGLTGLRLDDLMQREATRRAQRLTLIATAASIGMVAALGLAFYANTKRIEAITQRQIAERESAASRAAADFLVDTFKIANPATENPRTITALTILGRSADRARLELAAQPAIQVRLIDTVARAYTSLGLFKEARDALDKSGDVIRKAGPNGADALLTLALTHYRQGDLDTAVTIAEEADASIGKVGTGDAERDREIRGRVQEVIAGVRSEQGRLAESLAAYDKALGYYRASTRTKPETLARALNNRGLPLGMMGRQREARAGLLEANAIYRKLKGEQHSIVGQSWYAIANNDFQGGDARQAMVDIDKAMAIYNVVFDAQNYRRADGLSLRGQILRELKRPVEAVADLRQAVAINRKAYDGAHYMIGITDVYLALALSDLGKTDEALGFLDDAKRQYDGSYKGLHPNHGDLLVNRAVILAKAGRRAEAAADCTAGMAILNKTMDPKESFVVTSAKTCAALPNAA
ncbi:MAG: hypothetical protein CFE37_02180 [Alphaproteobacteria bacterium PA4]|nr:MAG: hypothetical protein CFE37_02180 [Alphaproteobacteria bacterium PA4]